MNERELFISAMKPLPCDYSERDKKFTDAGVQLAWYAWQARASMPERTAVLTYPAELNDDLEWILGLICFQCIEYARALRKGGRDIPSKAEAEQAHTLDWMLRHYMRDPANWRKNAADEARSFMTPPTESTGEPK